MSNIYDSSGNTVSAIYTADGTEIEIAPVIDFPEPNLATTGTFTSLFTTTTVGNTQGSCIDDDGNIYTVFYAVGAIVKYNIYTGEETTYSFTANLYGHANSLTYNPNTGYVYVASMKTTGEVYVLDPSNSMAVAAIKYALKGDGTALTPWCMAYDRNTRRFYLQSAGVLYQYDDDFNLVDYSVTFDIDDWGGTRQGMETDGTYIYGVSYGQNYLYVFDLTGTLVTTVNCTALTQEPEELMYDWNSGIFYIQQNAGHDTGGANILFANIKQYYTKAEMEEIITVLS